MLYNSDYQHLLLPDCKGYNRLRGVKTQKNNLDNCEKSYVYDLLYSDFMMYFDFLDVEPRTEHAKIIKLKLLLYGEFLPFSSCYTPFTV